MNITDKRLVRKSTTYADIEIGTLFSPIDRADMICMKTSIYGSDALRINSVNLSTGVLYSYRLDEEIVPIDNYEFNIY